MGGLARRWVGLALGLLALLALLTACGLGGGSSGERLDELEMRVLAIEDGARVNSQGLLSLASVVDMNDAEARGKFNTLTDDITSVHTAFAEFTEFQAVAEPGAPDTIASIMAGLVEVQNSQAVVQDTRSGEAKAWAGVADLIDILAVYYDGWVAMGTGASDGATERDRMRVAVQAHPNLEATFMAGLTGAIAPWVFEDLLLFQFWNGFADVAAHVVKGAGGEPGGG